MAEAADYVPNLLMIRLSVPFICTSTVNSDNSLSSIIFMVLLTLFFVYLKINFSATKMNSEKTPAGGGSRD